MVICPNSTPTLNEIIETANLFLGKPISFSELAKPNPCINPNKNTNKIRQGFSSLNSKFSIATNKIDSAMMGSTIAGGATRMFFMLRANVIECATVNAVACHRITFTLLLNKHRPITNKI